VKGGKEDEAEKTRSERRDEAKRRSAIVVERVEICGDRVRPKKISAVYWL